MTRPGARSATTFAMLVVSIVAVPRAIASPWSIPWRASTTAASPAEREPPRLRPAEVDDESSADAARREAAAAFADGESAFERGDYVLAASRFEHAHHLSPHQWTLYNLALARARSGNPLGAWHAFDELAASATVEPERREAERERDALLPLLAIVVVRGPSGARSCIDGAPVVIESQGRVERVVSSGVHRITTAARDENVELEAGTQIAVDATPQSSPRDRVRPWLIVATAATAAATGGAVAGAATATSRTSQGLAGAAAVAGSVALTATIIALVRRSRERRPANVELRCAEPD